MRSGKLTSVFLVCALVLSGCASSQIYAKNKEDGVYFTIPSGWKKIEQRDLNQRESESKSSGAADRLNLVTWQEAYSKKGEALPKDVFSLNSPKSPLVYVRVRTLSMEETQSISYNSLRDIIVPLTKWINNGNANQDFALINDYEAVQPKSRGVHTIYSFIGNDGVDQTINQISMVSEDRSKIYVLLVRAATKDYLANEKMLNKIADSFTIRGRI